MYPSLLEQPAPARAAPRGQQLEGERALRLAPPRRGLLRRAHGARLVAAVAAAHRQQRHADGDAVRRGDAAVGNGAAPLSRPGRSS